MAKKYNEHKFYKTSAWIKKRKDILQRDNFECQKCKDKGMQTQAQAVHHIVHLRDDRSLALVDSNLISLCNTCHNEEHPEKLKKYHADIHEERWE